MSYVPKYILKRMIPKDAVKAVEGGIQVDFINVISPIAIEEIPDENIADYFEASMNGKQLDAETKKKISFSLRDKTFTIENIVELKGDTIAVGEKLVIFLPFADAKAGEESEIEITIKLDNPFNVKVKRTLQ